MRRLQVLVLSRSCDRLLNRIRGKALLAQLGFDARRAKSARLQALSLISSQAHIIKVTLGLEPCNRAGHSRSGEALNAQLFR